MSDLYTLAHASEGVRQVDLTTLRLELGADEADEFAERLRSEHCIVLGSDPIHILKNHEDADGRRPFSEFIEMASAELADHKPADAPPPRPRHEPDPPPRGYGNKLEAEDARVRDMLAKLKAQGEQFYAVRTRIVLTIDQPITLVASSPEAARQQVLDRLTAPDPDGGPNTIRAGINPFLLLAQFEHKLRIMDTLQDAGWDMAPLSVEPLTEEETATLLKLTVRRRIATKEMADELTAPVFALHMERFFNGR